MSKSNPFNLPPPWNPGYDLPQNVDDEGLERRAYTTSWAPRGSFDDPKVGTAGYAVPGYVIEEGYGVGAMTTRWAPRGTYYGPEIKHWLDYPSARVVGRKPLPGGATQLQIQTMAGIELATGGMAPFTDYGQRVAATMIGTIIKLPKKFRAAALKKAMDQIDPALHRRGEFYAERVTAMGVPAREALTHGIAAAVTEGVIGELAELGKRRKRPQSGLLGMGCFGCAALGANDMMTMMSLQTSLLPAGSTPLTCVRTGYTWENNAWRRLMAGETVQNPGPASGVTGCQTRAEGTSTPVVETVVDGLPVTLPGEAPRLERFMGLDPTQKATLKKMLEAASGPGLAGAGGGMAPSLTWPTWEGIKMDPNVLSGKRSLKNVSRPAGHTLYFKGYAGGAFHLWLVPTLGIIDTLKAISEGIPIIGPVIKQIHDATEKLTCDLVSKPSTQQMAGQAAGTGPYGMALAAGVGIAAGQCAPPAVTCPSGLFLNPVTNLCETPPSVPTPPMNLTPILLLGGAAVAAYLFLGMKKS